MNKIKPFFSFLIILSLVINIIPVSLANPSSNIYTTGNNGDMTNTPSNEVLFTINNITCAMYMSYDPSYSLTVQTFNFDGSANSTLTSSIDDFDMATMRCHYYNNTHFIIAVLVLDGYKSAARVDLARVYYNVFLCNGTALTQITNGDYVGATGSSGSADVVPANECVNPIIYASNIVNDSFGHYYITVITKHKFSNYSSQWFTDYTVFIINLIDGTIIAIGDPAGTNNYYGLPLQQKTSSNIFYVYFTGGGAKKVNGLDQSISAISTMNTLTISDWSMVQPMDCYMITCSYNVYSGLMSHIYFGAVYTLNSTHINYTLCYWSQLPYFNSQYRHLTGQGLCDTSYYMSMFRNSFSVVSSANQYIQYIVDYDQNGNILAVTSMTLGDIEADLTNMYVRWGTTGWSSDNSALMSWDGDYNIGYGKTGSPRSLVIALATYRLSYTAYDSIDPNVSLPIGNSSSYNLIYVMDKTISTTNNASILSEVALGFNDTDVGLTIIIYLTPYNGAIDNSSNPLTAIDSFTVSSGTSGIITHAVTGSYTNLNGKHLGIGLYPVSNEGVFSLGTPLVNSSGVYTIYYQNATTIPQYIYNVTEVWTSTAEPNGYYLFYLLFNPPSGNQSGYFNGTGTWTQPSFNWSYPYPVNITTSNITEIMPSYNYSGSFFVGLVDAFASFGINAYALGMLLTLVISIMAFVIVALVSHGGAGSGGVFAIITFAVLAFFTFVGLVPIYIVIGILAISSLGLAIGISSWLTAKKVVSSGEE